MSLYEVNASSSNFLSRSNGRPKWVVVSLFFLAIYIIFALLTSIFEGRGLLNIMFTLALALSAGWYCFKPIRALGWLVGGAWAAQVIMMIWIYQSLATGGVEGASYKAAESIYEVIWFSHRFGLDNTLALAKDLFATGIYFYSASRAILGVK